MPKTTWLVKFVSAVHGISMTGTVVENVHIDLDTT